MRRLKLITVTMVLVGLWVLALPGAASAFTGFEPGVADGQEYREVVFLGGTPEVFKGTVKETVKKKGDIVQINLRYKLESESGTGKLNRTVKLTSQVETRGDQEVYVTELDNYNETIETAGQKFKTKKDYVFFSGSRVIDHQPAVDFITGNWYLKKVYEAGRRDKSEVMVELSGQTEGYNNVWGSGETRTMDMVLRGEPTCPIWQGTVRMAMNDNLCRDLIYVPSQPELISFTGGFVDELRGEELLTADYDLLPGQVPVENERGRRTRDQDEDEDEQNAAEEDDSDIYGGRNQGVFNLSAYSPPEQRRLFVKECKDVRGHWAQRPIEAMCGLGAYDIRGDYFHPGVACRRGEFIRALVTVGGLDIEPEEQQKAGRRRGQDQEQAYFFDVDSRSPYYKYVQTAGKKGLVETHEKFFRPDDNLTRAEAVTILIKAMGLEHLAPTPQFSTGFKDDYQIPSWAKDAVYVAQEYGLIRGDFTGGLRIFRPHDIVTRAEAAAMLDRFREFLNQDLRQDYRDHLYRYLP